MTVMANIVAMNFAFDIPVKIFSTNLLILAGWIAWYDVKRIINVFFLNKLAAAAHLRMPLKTRWKKILQSSLKVIAITYAFYATLGSAIKASRQRGDDVEKPPLYGIYDTQIFIKKGDTIPPLATDSARWKRMIINYADYVRIYTMTDSTQWMRLAVDTINKTVHFTSLRDSTQMFALHYNKPGKVDLQLQGSINNENITITFKQFDVNKFRLVNRGFHWINEYPFYR
jgi:hypothetical protein